MGRKEHVLSLEHEGVVYNLRPRDFTAVDDLEIIRATNRVWSLNDCFYLGNRQPSLSAVAALVWRYRVGNGETDLTYLDVMRTFTYDNITTVRDEARQDADPKASGVA